MDNKGILLRLFNDCTETKINLKNISDRIILQKIVFFLDELGITVGDYNFALETHGPFSQNLNNDIHDIRGTQKMYDGAFPEYIQNAIIFLKEEIFKKRLDSFQYSVSVWVEAIASLLYSKKYMYPTATLENNLSKLLELKTHLTDETANQAVLDCCSKFLQYSIKS